MNNKYTIKLLKIADSVYPDGLIGRILKGEERVGDKLAEFIVNEIKETSEGNTSKEINKNVIKALETAARELDDVIQALKR